MKQVIRPNLRRYSILLLWAEYQVTKIWFTFHYDFVQNLSQNQVLGFLVKLWRSHWFCFLFGCEELRLYNMLWFLYLRINAYIALLFWLKCAIALVFLLVLAPNRKRSYRLVLHHTPNWALCHTNGQIDNCRIFPYFFCCCEPVTVPT